MPKKVNMLLTSQFIIQLCNIPLSLPNVWSKAGPRPMLVVPVELVPRNHCWVPELMSAHPHVFCSKLQVPVTCVGNINTHYW